MNPRGLVLRFLLLSAMPSQPDEYRRPQQRTADVQRTRQDLREGRPGCLSVKRGCHADDEEQDHYTRTDHVKEASCAVVHVARLCQWVGSQET